MEARPMRQGFFTTAADNWGLPISLIPACGQCGLFRTCHSPKMPVDGKGRKGILVIGESPGKNEDDQGRPFVGKSGEKVWETFARFGVSRSDCWITNAARCRPQNNKLPPKAVEHCRPLVIQAINELKPEKIILLGGSAVSSVIGWLWPKDSQGYDISRWRGWRIPDQRNDCWVCPMWHPSFILRSDGDNRMFDSDVAELIWHQDIKKALELCGRPWKGTLPNFKARITVEYDCDRAASVVRDMVRSG